MRTKALLLFFCLSLPLHGQSAKLTLNLDHLAGKASESVNLNLEGDLLQFAIKLLGSQEPNFRRVVKGLQGIYVRSFDFDKEGAYSSADVKALRKQLSGKGWNCPVSVRGKNEDTDVCLCQDAGKVLGLAIVTSELKSLTVVNILGSVSLDDLSALHELGVPRLDIEKEKKPDKKSKE